MYCFMLCTSGPAARPIASSWQSSRLQVLGNQVRIVGQLVIIISHYCLFACAPQILVGIINWVSIELHAGAQRLAHLACTAAATANSTESTVPQTKNAPHFIFVMGPACLPASLLIDGLVCELISRRGSRPAIWFGRY